MTPQKRDMKIGKHYLIVEGEGKGKVGICRNRRETSFERINGELELENGTKVWKRLSDVQSEEELQAKLSSQRNGTPA